MPRPADYLAAAEAAGHDRDDERVRRWAQRAVVSGTPPDAAVADLDALRRQRAELARLDLAEVENSIEALRKNAETTVEGTTAHTVFLELLEERDGLLDALPPEGARAPELGRAAQAALDFLDGRARSELTDAERAKLDQLVGAASDEQHAPPDESEAEAALRVFTAEHGAALAEPRHPEHKRRVREWGDLTARAAGVEEPGAENTTDPNAEEDSNA